MDQHFQFVILGELFNYLSFYLKLSLRELAWEYSCPAKISRKKLAVHPHYPVPSVLSIIKTSSFTIQIDKLRILPVPKIQPNSKILHLFYKTTSLLFKNESVSQRQKPKITQKIKKFGKNQKEISKQKIFCFYLIIQICQQLKNCKLVLLYLSFFSFALTDLKVHFIFAKALFNTSCVLDK